MNKGSIAAALVSAVLSLLLASCGRQPAGTAPVTAAASTAMPGRVKLYFDVGSAAPDPGASTQLDAIVAYAKAHPGARVSVSGYNDPNGDAEANEELAKNRALAVRNVLVGRGVPETSVDRDRPVVGANGEREARRVEVSIE